MFRNVFSFEGRIRRLEYGISYLIYIGYALLSGFVGGALGLIDQSDNPKNDITVLIILSPAILFMLAQGAKRCHDRNNSGWYQIIPFYGLWMLFGDGDIGPNDYGENPKGLYYDFGEEDEPGPEQKE